MPNERTETQPRPNLSTEPGRKDQASKPGTQTQPSPNISTEHQEEGDARRPSDTLDRGQDESDTIPRKTSLTKNA